MEFGPIIRALGRNKTRFVLIAVEVALTLAIVVNCVNMMKDMHWQMVRPTGLDEQNIITVVSQPFSEEFKDENYLDDGRKADVALLRALPGVKAADAISAIPLSSSGSSSGYKPLGSTMNTLPAGVFTGGTGMMDALGVRLIRGRPFDESDINDSKSKNVIITKAYADRLFPDGNALGQQIQGRTPENPDTIVGIIDHMHGSWPRWRYISHVLLSPAKPGNFNRGVRYIVRAEPGQVDGLVRVIEERLLQSNSGRNVTVETLTSVKARTFTGDRAVIKMLGAVIFLLVFVTALGIVGITSFSVTERLHHIGTRRALGARKFDIVRYFLTENWVITTTGILLGVGLTYGLNYVLVTAVNGVKMDWRLVAAGVAAMWFVGLAAALTPAARGARISPAVAARTL